MTINSPPLPPPLPPTRAENVLCDRENLVKLKGCTIEYQNMPPVGRLNKLVQVSIQLPPPLPLTLPTPTKSLKTKMPNLEIIPKGFKNHENRDKNKENIMMSKTPILKRWLETEKKEDQKFKLTKCVKFQEPTISTSKKRTKLTKKQKDLKKQSSCFKSYFSAKKQTSPPPPKFPKLVLKNTQDKQTPIVTKKPVSISKFRSVQNMFEQMAGNELTNQSVRTSSSRLLTNQKQTACRLLSRIRN